MPNFPLLDLPILLFFFVFKDDDRKMEIFTVIKLDENL